MALDEHYDRVDAIMDGHNKPLDATTVRRAQQYVAKHSAGFDDCRNLLDLLGILAPAEEIVVRAKSGKEARPGRGTFQAWKKQ